VAFGARIGRQSGSHRRRVGGDPVNG